MLRPVSNLSVLNDLVREETSPIVDESRKKSALKTPTSKRELSSSKKVVRFEDSVTKKVILDLGN